MSGKLALVGLLVVVSAAPGCGGGGSSSATTASKHAGRPAATNLNAYFDGVMKIRNDTIDPAAGRFAHAHTTRGIIKSAKSLEDGWATGAKQLAALEGGPASAKKIQAQIAASLRNAAAQMGRELSSSHPDRAKLGDVFSRTEAQLDPLWESLFSAS